MVTRHNEKTKQNNKIPQTILEDFKEVSLTSNRYRDNCLNKHKALFHRTSPLDYENIRSAVNACVMRERSAGF